MWLRKNFMFYVVVVKVGSRSEFAREVGVVVDRDCLLVLLIGHVLVQLLKLLLVMNPKTTVHPPRAVTSKLPSRNLGNILI